MLIKQPQVEIASKIVRTPSGELVRAYFALVTIEGRTEVRFLGTRPIEASEADFAAQAASAFGTDAPLLLECAGVCTYGETPVRRPASVSSPFYTLDFLTSQLTRAPSLA